MGFRVRVRVRVRARVRVLSNLLLAQPLLFRLAHLVRVRVTPT